jgi:hypothetical protein
MLLVIFGAGASYDSDRGWPSDRNTDRDQYRPPLASGLFAERFNEVLLANAECVAVASQLRYSKNIEHDIERFAAQAANGEKYPYRARQLLALRYYIRDLIVRCEDEWPKHSAGATNYVSLLDKVMVWQQERRESVVFTTFNYDVLLEQATERVYYRHFDSLDSYVSDTRCLVVKLHGSTNWMREVALPTIDSYPPTIMPFKPMAQHANQLVWSETYGMFRKNGQVNRGREVWVPAIAVPVATKFSFECPPSHRESLASAFPYVTHVLVIGWRGQEQHFLNLWNDARKESTGRRPLQKLLVVSGTGEGATQTIERLRVVMGQAQVQETAVGGGFSDFLKGNRLEEFLSD